MRIQALGRLALPLQPASGARTTRAGAAMSDRPVFGTWRAGASVALSLAFVASACAVSSTPNEVEPMATTAAAQAGPRCIAPGSGPCSVDTDCCASAGAAVCFEGTCEVIQRPKVACLTNLECGASGDLCTDFQCRCGQGPACSGDTPICTGGQCVAAAPGQCACSSLGCPVTQWALKAEAMTVGPDGFVRSVETDGFNTFIGTFGESGDTVRGDVLLQVPASIRRPLAVNALAIAPDGTIGVSETREDALLLFAPNGTFLAELVPSPMPQSGQATDVAFGPAGQRYLLAGNQLFGWSASNTPFVAPARLIGRATDLAVAPDGTVFVLSPNACVVLAFPVVNPSDDVWQFGQPQEFGTCGFGALPGSLANAGAIAVGPDGTVFIASSGGAGTKVSVFTEAGAFLGEWSATGVSSVKDLAVAPNGDLFLFGTDNEVAVFCVNLT